MDGHRFRVSSNNRSASSGCIGLSEFHHIEDCLTHEMGFGTADEFPGSSQVFDPDAFFQGMLQFFPPDGHLFPGMPIDDGHFPAEA